MSNLVAFDPKLHSQVRLDLTRIAASCAEVQLLPVVPAEFAQVATQSPIVLTKHGHTGQFVFVALFGFCPGENLFWQQGQFQGLYQPLQLRRQPFFLGYEGEHPLLCLDLNHPALLPNGHQDGELLVEADGRDGPYLQSVKACLGELMRGEQQQQQLMPLLAEFDLIQPLSLEITFADQHSVKLQGLYSIDQQKLAALPAQALWRFHQQGALAAIYTQLASMAQLYPLIERKNALLRSHSC